MTFRKCLECDEQARCHWPEGSECKWCPDCCNDMKLNGKHDATFVKLRLRGKYCDFCLLPAVHEVSEFTIVCWNHKYCDDKCHKSKSHDGSHSIVIAEFEIDENRNTNKTR